MNTRNRKGINNDNDNATAVDGWTVSEYVGLVSFIGYYPEMKRRGRRRRSRL
jgi:hypothetical protein